MAPQRLGQHFLEDSSVVDSIIAAADLRSTDTVVEIGPGRGALTGELVNRSGRVLLIEYDADLADGLAAKYEADPNVRVFNADARDFGSDLDPWLADCGLVERSGPDRRYAKELPLVRVSSALLRRSQSLSSEAEDPM